MYTHIINQEIINVQYVELKNNYISLLNLYLKNDCEQKKINIINSIENVVFIISSYIINIIVKYF